MSESNPNVNTPRTPTLQDKISPGIQAEGVHQIGCNLHQTCQAAQQQAERSVDVFEWPPPQNVNCHDCEDNCRDVNADLIVQEHVDCAETQIELAT